VIGAHETKSALVIFQATVARTKVALDTMLIYGMPVPGRHSKAGIKGFTTHGFRRHARALSDPRRIDCAEEN